ncbi:sensor histidine kinase [Romboutsia maritimum]|nr:ATP-binding protein [Romboutsia maritimum]
MKKTILLFYTVISILIALFMQNKVYADNEKSILFISSYTPSFISFNDQLKGLNYCLNNNYHIQVEYMNSEKFTDEKHELHFYNLLKLKLENYKNFDAVVLADDAALNFGIKYKNSLFKDIPIVFLGVSEEKNIVKAKNENMSGVVEYSSISETLNLIHNIYNNNKNLVLIAGNHIKYKHEINDFFKLQSKLSKFNFKYIEIPPKADDEFLNKLRNLNSKDDVVLFVYPYRDGIGRSISILESNDIISKNVSAPVYTTLSYNLENSMIGGKVICHFEQGKKAGKLILDILENGYTNQRIITYENTNTWMFNYYNLKSNVIHTDLIPKDSIIINKPIPFFVTYKKLIIPTLITFIGFISIILALIMYSVKKRKSEEVLYKAKLLAEDANNAKNNFISNISHELRTPVAIIYSSTQLLRKLISKYDQQNEKVKIINNNLNIITQNSNRLLRLINNIIDVAKIDSDFTNLNLTNENVVSLIEDTVLSVLPYAEEKNLEVIFDTNVEELIMAVDKEKLERVILNLLSNAIKFSYSKGKIFANLIATDDKLKFIISDNGIGIDEKNLSKIFDKFMQVDNLLTRRNEGSGIGLSIVKSFVELHNGNVYLTSKLGEGSTFTIELPIKIIDDDLNNANEINAHDVNVNIELSDIYVKRDSD